MIVQEIKQKPLSFESFTYSFIDEMANQAVHTLAAEGMWCPNQKV